MGSAGSWRRGITAVRVIWMHGWLPLKSFGLGRRSTSVACLVPVSAKAWSHREAIRPAGRDRLSAILRGVKVGPVQARPVAALRSKSCLGRRLAMNGAGARGGPARGWAGRMPCD